MCAFVESIRVRLRNWLNAPSAQEIDLAELAEWQATFHRGQMTRVQQLNFLARLRGRGIATVRRRVPGSARVYSCTCGEACCKCLALRSEGGAVSPRSSAA